MSADSDRLHTEVAIWLARLERGLQAQDAVRLRQWLQIPAQRDAIVEAAKLYHGPDIIAILAEMVPVGFGNAPPPRPTRKRPKIASLAIASFAVGAALLAFIVAPVVMIHRTMPGVIGSAAARYRPLDSVLPVGAEAYATKAGETRTFSLADGTQLLLNSHTRVGVLFSVGERLATVQYGEVLFDIRSKRERAFEVDAGGRHFRAPQSKFDVRVINPKTVELTVLEGGVTVQGLPWRWPTTPAEARIFDPHVYSDATVGPLQSVWLDDDTMARFAITAANAQARLSWRPEEILYVTP